MPNPTDQKQGLPRNNERFMSHAIVEVRRFKNLPFFIKSAVLLDISLGGYKLEFTDEVILEQGKRFWVNIPLGPLGIFSPNRITCQAECVWFDKQRYRAGGYFVSLSDFDKQIIRHVVDLLENKGGRLPDPRA